jgi:uncharacterized protein with HEPN domain
VPFRDPIQRFTDIIDNIERILRFTSGLGLQGFAANEQAVLAVKYSLPIIGEAAAKRDERAVSLCPDIPRRQIRGLGNRLRHHYDNIDVVRIWLLLERDLPPLKTACLGALRELEGNG